MANPTGPFVIKLLNAVTTDETTSQPIYCLGYNELTVFLQGSAATISSGVVRIEQAIWLKDSEPAYGGTWSLITDFTASDVTAGKQKAVQLSVAAYGYIRARVETAIGGGGTVSCYLIGQS